MNTSTKPYQRFLYKSLLLVFFVLTLGCTEDILDTTPETSISESVAYSTPEKILANVYNLYSKVQNQGYYGGRHIIYNEQRGEEFSQNDGNANVGALFWSHNAIATSQLIGDLWTAAYSGINNANILIKNLETTTVVPAALRDQYIAEAKFLRAFNYFALVQTFARPYQSDNGASLGLPLRLTAETSVGNNDLARSSVAQVYDQIISDLNDAENGLPANYAVAVSNSQRAHKASAIALKTRVFLVKGDYAKVVDEASKIVPSAAPFQYVAGNATFKLESDVVNVFKGSYTGTEALFFIPFNDIDAPGIQSALAPNYFGSVVISLNPAGIVSNSTFSAASADRRKVLVAKKSGQDVLIKFPKITAPYTDYIPVIRYAEVILNYAEAAAETNDLGLALTLLNTVRQRSDASFVFPTDQVNTKEALIATILTERRIELLGEGFRVSDLQRRLQVLPSKTGAIGIAPAVSPDANNYIWPIPSDELATNKLMEPNP